MGWDCYETWGDYELNEWMDGGAFGTDGTDAQTDTQIVWHGMN
jgi:hypothetical protein